VKSSQDAPLDPVIRQRIIAFVPRLQRFCRGLAGSHDRGDDLLQATVERALSRIKLWQPGTNLESWMFRIARNLQINAYRAAAVRGSTVDVELADEVQAKDLEAELESRSELAVVERAMATLPPEQREVLATVVLDGRSYAEAAELLEIPVGTVMSRLARARGAIRAFVNGPSAWENAA
jgi:RNA polymerase sigma-70 factor, ECF subfamily